MTYNVSPFHRVAYVPVSTSPEPDRSVRQTMLILYETT